jgi:hypothetical protein
MPVHDWTRVDAGVFHAFHHDWITYLSRALNRGLLPAEYYALPEQIAGGLGPDVLTLRRPGGNGAADAGTPSGGIALALVPPKVRLQMSPAANQYAVKAKAVVVRHVTGHRVVAMVEIVSPGNKNNQNGLNAFVRKAREALAAGIHLLIVDLLPPGPRDPQGVHRAVWGDDCGDDYAPPADQPLSCVAYIGGAGARAFLEPLAVGEALPEMPLFLTPEIYVPVPLEATYQATWEDFPAAMKELLDTPGQDPPAGS